MDQLPDRIENSDRRAFLNTFGKAAIIAPPTITILLSTSMSSPAIARSTGGGDPHVHGPFGNNGVGNGNDPQPPGNPPINDGPGTGPGNPGNNGHHDNGPLHTTFVHDNSGKHGGHGH
jgi:hypothetical protein